MDKSISNSGSADDLGKTVGIPVGVTLAVAVIGGVGLFLFLRWWNWRKDRVIPLDNHGNEDTSEVTRESNNSV